MWVVVGGCGWLWVIAGWLWVIAQILGDFQVIALNTDTPRKNILKILKNGPTKCRFTYFRWKFYSVSRG